MRMKKGKLEESSILYLHDSDETSFGRNSSEIRPAKAFMQEMSQYKSVLAKEVAPTAVTQSCSSRKSDLVEKIKLSSLNIENNKSSLADNCDKSGHQKNILNKIQNGTNLRSRCQSNARQNMTKSGEEKKLKRRRNESGDDNDQSDHSSAESQDYIEGDDVDSWRGSKSVSSLKSKAKRLFSHCESVGRNLRYHLRQWEGESSNSEYHANDDDANETFCTSLLSISTTSLNNEDLSSNESNVLGTDYLKNICPGLVLKAYQVVGVNWLKLLYENKINGVLADDMGLGKTVQSIAFLGWLKSKQATSAKNKVHLVVVPASTLANWELELKRFCPSLVVVKYHGSQIERADIRYDLHDTLEGGKLDILLSTFTIFERESGKADRVFLCKQKFEYLIIDEAHCLKVSTSSRFINLNEIKAVHRLLLSGTPVQNDLSELLALMSFIMPDIFRKIGIEEVLEGFGWDRNSKSTTLNSSAVSINQLRAMLAPFVLRRLKSDVLDQLVDKVSHVEKVMMTEYQSNVYDDILSSYAEKKKLAALNAAIAIASGKFKTHVVKSGRLSGTKTLSIDENENQVIIPEVIDFFDDIVHEPPIVASKAPIREISASEARHLFTALRKAANHPLLLRVRYRDDIIMDKIAMTAYTEGRFGRQCDYKRVRDEIDKFSDFDIHQLCLEYPESLGRFQLDANVLYDSKKMQKLRELLPFLVAKGHRILIFSQWTRILDLLEVLLNDIDLEFLRLDGSTPVKDRQELISGFSDVGSTTPIFLLSTKAGGLGINLTAADTVIIHDLDFNPENDRQAEDRCHRIGQTKEVQVYRLVTEGTVDEDIYQMGERKRMLTEAVLSDKIPMNGELMDSSTHPDDDGSDGELEDIGAIGRILQKALKKNQEKKIVES